MDFRNVSRWLGRALMIVSMPLFLCFSCPAASSTPYNCYREIYNATSQPLRVVYGTFNEADTEFKDGRVSWEELLPVNGVYIPAIPRNVFRYEDDVLLSNATEPAPWKMVFFNEERTKVLYVVGGEDLGNPAVWTSERWQSHPEKYQQSFPSQMYDPHAYHTFVYWTITLTDSMLRTE